MKSKFVDIFKEVNVMTGGHAARVSVIAKEIAQELGYSEENINLITLGAAIHDAGKILTQPLIKDTNKQPTEEDWKIIRSHTSKGYELLTQYEETKNYSEFAKSHHEQMDGSGYPFGLQSENIPLDIRIVTVADVFEAIIDDRGTLNPPRTIEEANKIIRNLSDNGKFDKAVVDALFRFVEKKNLNNDNVEEFFNKETGMITDFIYKYFIN